MLLNGAVLNGVALNQGALSLGSARSATFGAVVTLAVTPSVSRVGSAGVSVAAQVQAHAVQTFVGSTTLNSLCSVSAAATAVYFGRGAFDSAVSFSGSTGIGKQCSVSILCECGFTAIALEGDDAVIFFRTAEERVFYRPYELRQFTRMAS